MDPSYVTDTYKLCRFAMNNKKYVGAGGTNILEVAGICDDTLLPRSAWHAVTGDAVPHNDVMEPLNGAAHVHRSSELQNSK